MNNEIDIKCCCTIGALKKAMSKIDNDNARVNLKLCVDSKPTKENSESWQLRKMCNNLFNLLSDACKCVEHCAKEEYNTKEKTIYYDRNNGPNVGAKGLLKDVIAVLNAYPEEMMTIDLFSDHV
ncbi:MAG: hypothetical protein J6W16_07850 [Methanobrevibacter sp.]|nr:hypothetical protein [Methanobrevibacter sp.]